MMYGREKSDSAIVAGKPTNKAVPTAAEPVERRAGAKGNANQQSTHRTQSRERVSQALERVRQVSPSHTQGGSRVREFRSHEPGAVSNDRPYRTSLRVFRSLTRLGHRPNVPCTLRVANFQSELAHRDVLILECWRHMRARPPRHDSEQFRSAPRTCSLACGRLSVW